MSEDTSMLDWMTPLVPKSSVCVLLILHSAVMASCTVKFDVAVAAIAAGLNNIKPAETPNLIPVLMLLPITKKRAGVLPFVGEDCYVAVLNKIGALQAVLAEW